MNFDEWLKEEYGTNHGLAFWEVDAGKKAWDASRHEALLEAADLCHAEHVRDDLTGDYRYGSGICEHNIRRMAKEIK
jgi:hypothetical protein